MGFVVLLWKGKGWIVAIAVFLCSLAGELITVGITGNTNYYKQKNWPLSLALASAATLSYLLCRKLGKDPARQIENAKGDMVYDVRKDTLLLIPIAWWTWMLLGFALINLLDA